MKRSRIILYEKDPIIEADISLMLQEIGFEVLKMGQEEVIDIILEITGRPEDTLVISNADLLLDHLSMLTFVNPLVNKIPFLIISALRVLDLKRLEELPLQITYLSKPVSRSQLRAALGVVRFE